MEYDKITTIQVRERTLRLLKRLKAEMNAHSYDEVIEKKMTKPIKSMAGAFKDLSLKDVLKELQDERRKSDRF